MNMQACCGRSLRPAVAVERRASRRGQGAGLRRGQGGRARTVSAIREGVRPTRSPSPGPAPSTSRRRSPPARCSISSSSQARSSTSFIKDGKIAAGSQGRSGEVRGRRCGEGRRAEARPQLRRRRSRRRCSRPSRSAIRPARAASTCRSLFEKMGIADQIKAKVKQNAARRPGRTVIAKRRSRDRLPAGQRADPRGRHRLPRAAAGGRAEHHGVLKRHPRRRQGADRSQGSCRNSSPRRQRRR